MLKNKKAQTGNAVSSMITLIVGIGITAIVIIFLGVLSGTTWQINEADINAIANNVITGESFTFLNNTVISLSNNDIQNGSMLIYNSSNNFTTTDFTIDYVDGTVQSNTLTNATINNTVLSVNYVWGRNAVRSSLQSGLVSGFQSFNTAGNYIPILALAIVIVLVLGLIVGLGGITGTRGGSGGAL